ncbi:MAG: hypothetical protein ACRC41_13625 [Sarcina sp.]
MKSKENGVNKKEFEVVEAEIVEIEEELKLEKRKEVYIEKKKEYKTLRVMFENDKNNIHFNFALPLTVISMFGSISSFIPQSEMKQINDSGFSFSDFDFKKLLKDIEDGNIVNPLIFKQDLGKDGMLKVVVE